MNNQSFLDESLAHTFIQNQSGEDSSITHLTSPAPFDHLTLYCAETRQRSFLDFVVFDQTAD